MSLESMAGQESLRPRRRWVEGALLTGFLLLLLFGIAAFAAYFLLLRTVPAPTLDDPLQALQPEQVVPELALQQLAGDPPAALAYQTLQAGEVATSHAIVLFDVGLDGASRSGLYGQLVRRYVAAEAHSQAAITLSLSRALAVLDPAIAPLERAQLLTQSAGAYLTLEQSAAALDAGQQAMLVGAQTPDLLPAQRQQIFSALQPMAAALDDRLFSAQLDDLSRNPFLTPSGVLIIPQMRVLMEPVAYDQSLLDATAARQAAALQLTERIRFTNGADTGPEVQALAAALQQEDQVRSEYYARMSALPPTPAQQLWLLFDQRAWLTLKLRIAMGGFGLSLVPPWESATVSLQQGLAQNAGAVDVAVKALAASLSDPIERAMLEAEGLQWLALQAELGLYADAPVNEIGLRLAAVQEQLGQAGAPLALPIRYAADATPPGYRIQP